MKKMWKGEMKLAHKDFSGSSMFYYILNRHVTVVNSQFSSSAYKKKGLKLK